MGYYKQPMETARVIDNLGYVHTGDAGCLDDKGFLFISGRQKDLIRTIDG